MTDWIDAEKQRMQKRQEDDSAAQKIRLHELAVIAVKAPLFWDATLTAVASIVDRLKQEFPKIESHHLACQNADGALSLLRQTYPTEYLAGRLESSAGVVMLKSFRRESPDSSGGHYTHSQIGIKIDKDDNLRFVFGGRDYEHPDGLAEAIVRSVVGF